DGETIRRAIREAEQAGVKEIYFTGGEPFLHGEILPLLELALGTAPTTVLTNGTLIGPEQADALAAMAARAPYSLEIRVSLDDTDRERNDRGRGEGAWAKAVGAGRRGPGGGGRGGVRGGARSCPSPPPRGPRAPSTRRAPACTSASAISCTSRGSSARV